MNKYIVDIYRTKCETVGVFADSEDEALENAKGYAVSDGCSTGAQTIQVVVKSCTPVEDNEDETV